MNCPSCDARELPLVVTASEVASELELCERFFHERMDGRFSAAELTDITNVAHGAPAAIARCPQCGILVRDDEVSFREDAYEARILEAIHHEHVAAFRKKRLRNLLARGSRVIEIGSYVGGFLQVASECGWNAAGVDVGGDTSRFTRRRGLPTFDVPFEECRFADRSIDGIFIWNCFEQLAAPRETLAEIARVLKTRGLVIIRIPDARFYVTQRNDLLGYNSLLGWPHRYGYDLRALRRLCETSALRFVSARRTAAMRPRRTSMHEWARHEEIAAMSDAANRGWLEVLFECRGGLRPPALRGSGGQHLELLARG